MMNSWSFPDDSEDDQLLADMTQMFKEQVGGSLAAPPWGLIEFRQEPVVDRHS